MRRATFIEAVQSLTCMRGRTAIAHFHACNDCNQRLLLKSSGSCTELPLNSQCSDAPALCALQAAMAAAVAAAAAAAAAAGAAAVAAAAQVGLAHHQMGRLARRAQQRSHYCCCNVSKKSVFDNLVRMLSLQAATAAAAAAAAAELQSSTTRPRKSRFMYQAAMEVRDLSDTSIFCGGHHGTIL